MIVLLVLLLATACAPAGTPTPTPTPSGEGRHPLPADRVRYAVVSHPWVDLQNATDYEVLRIELDGTLSTTDQHFSMGRATQGRIAFTPDGEIGLAVQDDGSLGVFRLDPDGTPEVLNPALDGFYASQVVMGPLGLHAWVVDFNWAQNGGGLYQLTIGEDDSVTVDGLLLAGQSLGALALLDDGRALLGGRALGDTQPGPELFAVDLADPNQSPSSLSLFADNEAMVSALGISSDGAYAVLGDNNIFSGTGNRLGIASIQGGLNALEEIPNISDPVAVWASPLGKSMAVILGEGNAVLRMEYDPAWGTAPTLAGEVTYSHGPPQLPLGSDLITRGSLAGHLYLAEVQALRHLAFLSNGNIEDLDRITFGDGSAMYGALGLQP